MMPQHPTETAGLGLSASRSRVRQAIHRFPVWQVRRCGVRHILLLVSHPSLWCQAVFNTLSRRVCGIRPQARHRPVGTALWVRQGLRGARHLHLIFGRRRLLHKRVECLLQVRRRNPVSTIKHVKCEPARFQAQDIHGSRLPVRHGPPTRSKRKSRTRRSAPRPSWWKVRALRWNARVAS